MELQYVKQLVQFSFHAQPAIKQRHCIAVQELLFYW